MAAYGRGRVNTNAHETTAKYGFVYISAFSEMNSI